MTKPYPGLTRARVRTREAFWRWIALWLAVSAILAVIEWLR